MPNRRSILSLGLVATMPLAAPALAQTYPSRPIRVLVPYAPGGNSDTMMRLIQPRMSEFLGGATIVIENRTGAGGALAAGVVAAAPADGYTLLFDAASFLIAQFANRDLPFDYETAFAPVALVGELPYVLAVSAQSGIRDFPGYLDAARKVQGGMPYGTPGVGNVGHLAGALLSFRSGIPMEHVPYRGGADVARDLSAGTLPSGYLGSSSIKPALEAGRAVAIALTSGERRGGIEGIPTIAESGFPGFDLTSWNALFCRSGTPEPVRARLEAAVAHATADQEVRARLTASGTTPMPADSAKLTERLTRERAMLRQLIRDTGISFG
ncbi:tripartite tricarboxylate transporter substrate binding protein [Roseomonas terrae]|uniref:Tripartite tricarboxylate transporter substrate binding protein n=1 Tax=Neoroseomonas terrae TaxID=424799 RepID=A0ABS5EDE1_9PROT|nr:tripartite tricarboxylate transporter substrate binding protein [Neoroseomonas terrae]MBR0649031.1 tripartite tricarboxylate transporter substrate binding protein [Neoroseomonas terrae]